MEDYVEKRESYLSDKEEYLKRKASEFTWFKEWTQLHNYDNDPYDTRWFIGGHVNLTYELLDRHALQGHGDDQAIIYDDSNNSTVTMYTFKDLLDKVSRLAGVLSECGIGHGDHVTVYLPAIPEAVIAMLATVRLGAIYSVLITFHPESVMVDRFQDFQPKMIITTNCEFKADGTKFNPKEYLDRVLEQTEHKIDKCLVLQRPCNEPAPLIGQRDLDWQQAMVNSTPREAVPVEINEAIFFIYTSGTTGKPKGVIISARYMAFMIGLVEDLFVGMRPKEGERAVSLSTSLYSWIGGHLGGLFAPLYRGITMVMSETPVCEANVAGFYRLLAEHKVNRMFISTGVLRSVIRKDPDGEIIALYKDDFKLSKLTLGGMPGDKATFAWAHNNFKVDVSQVYGLTEVGVITTYDLSDGRKYSDHPEMSCGKICPGFTVKVLRDDGTKADANEIGRTVIQMPTPVLLNGYHNDKDNRKFINDYLTTFPGYAVLHDEAYMDAAGHLFVQGRSDSVFKFAGNRISCDALEEIFYTHPRVAECIVVTKPSEDKRSQIPVGLFILKEAANVEAGSKHIGRDEDVPDELRRVLVNQIGDWLTVESILQVQDFPKTTTGKLARETIRSIVRQEQEFKDTKDPVLKHLWNTYVKATSGQTLH